MCVRSIFYRGWRGEVEKKEERKKEESTHL